MKKLKIIALLLPVLLLAGCAADKPGATDTASIQTETASALSETTPVPAGTAGQAAFEAIVPADAKAIIGTEGVVLLDVRTPEEFAEAHIADAQLLPYDEIAQRADELPADKDAAIIVYCRSGRRSAIAAQTLVGLGYTKVYDLGGIQSWPYDTVAGG